MRRALLCVVLLASGACKDAREEAAAKAREAEAKAKEARTQVQAKVFDAAIFGLKAKSELDKVYRSTSDYDLELSSEATDGEGMKAHEAKVAAMPNVKVGDLTVGYEESEERSLNGKTYARHFRATWAKDGRKVGVGYYSREQLDAAAFAALLQKLVPAVQLALSSG